MGLVNLSILGFRGDCAEHRRGFVPLALGLLEDVSDSSKEEELLEDRQRLRACLSRSMTRLDFLWSSGELDCP